MTQGLSQTPRHPDCHRKCLARCH